MTLNDLIERLEEYREMIGGDAEVRLMTQANYPFENGIAGVTAGWEINGTGDEDDPEDGDVEHDDVVYIVEGRQLCYGTKRAWDRAR